MKFASLPQLSDAHYRRPLLHTPFFEASRPWIQTDSFIAWTGYSTPGVYSTTEHEYFAIRNSCALFDLTPMVKRPASASVFPGRAAARKPANVLTVTPDR